MRAIVFHEFGEPAEVLKVENGSDPPVPSRGELRVRMLAAPVNPSDLMTIRGAYTRLPTLPATPGYEGVGVVEASGGGLLGRFLLGKRVAVLNSPLGSWREQTLASARQAIPLPADLPVEQAAMFFINPATAYIMTRKVLGAGGGEWLLQTAAGSALGRMVIRLGRQFGFRTLNVVRRDEQAAELKQLGADAVVVFDPSRTSADDFVREVRGLTGGGVPYAIDPVGGETGSAVVRCLGRGGRMLVYGTLSGAPLRFSPRDLMTPGAAVEGFWLGNWMARQKLPGKLRLVSTLKSLMKQGVLTADVAHVYPLDEVAEAVRAAEQPAKAGKILIRIGE